ncbi:putative endonuclease 4 [Oculina patagonica]
MRRSVRLAARAIEEITSQTSKAVEVSGSTSSAKLTKGEGKSSAKERIKPQKSKATKRAREKSTTENGENEQKGDTLSSSVITEEKPKPKIKRVKTDPDVHTAIKSEHNTQPLFTQEKLIGAHVSISGGLHNAVSEALAIGAKSFALFLRSQRQWASKPLEDKAAELFKEACAKGNFSPHSILPHGIYLMNCGSPDDETLSKSRSTLVDELQRCEKLGLSLYNFHPGSTCGKITVEDSINKIAESINLAHKETKYVVTVLENMSCQGNTIGGKFEELRDIIDRVQDKSRVGVCLDTCHAFAAGYDIASEKGFTKMMDEFETIVGFKYLRGVHLNDSKGGMGCHLDRHENIGKGKIGVEAFRRLMRDPRFNGIPMVLETPCVTENTYKKEIKQLYAMIK